MSGTTSRVAISKMARAEFGDKRFDKMIGQPTLTSIQVLITQLSKVVRRFTTRQCTGKHGCLALVLDETEMRFTPSISNIAFGPTPNTAAINTAIAENMKGHKLLKL